MRPRSTLPGRSVTRTRWISDVDWTVEGVNDLDAVQVDPYWTSRVQALAIIGYSPDAGAVLVVLAYRDLDGDLHGMTAWPATGRALRLYTEGRAS